MTNTIKNNYFYGKEVSSYGVQNKRVDYATLAHSFDAVLNNDIYNKAYEMGFYWEQVNGLIDNQEEIERLQEIKEEAESNLIDAINEDDKELEEHYQNIFDKLQEEIEELEYEEEHQYETEIYQYYIISNNGADILQTWTNEIVYYCEDLDMYLWGVTHWGTSWDYVLTNIEIETEEQAQ